MEKIEQKFYDFRRRCVNGVLINNKYTVTTKEFKDLIDNIVTSIIELSENRWVLILEEGIVNNNNILYVEKI